MHHLEIRTLQNTPQIHQPPQKVLIIQLQIDHKHLLTSISSSTASKTEAGQQHARLSLLHL